MEKFGHLFIQPRDWGKISIHFSAEDVDAVFAGFGPGAASAAQFY